MNEYYTCKIGVVDFFFEVDKEVVGIPNKILGFGVATQMCFVPSKGSIFIHVPGTSDLQEAYTFIYSMENFILPIDECHLVTKESKYYKLLSEGFGI